MIIDRIEGEFAVVEISKGEFKNIPLARIAGNARDGAVLQADGQGNFFVDEEETARRQEHARSRLRSLFG